MPCSPAIPMSGAISFSDHPFLSAIGRRRHASHDAVYIRLIRSLFLFRNYGKAGMRQPSEPERAPIEEGLTQHTVIVGRNNDLTRLCRTFSSVVVTHCPLPQREVIVVWHVASYPELC
jgi:hypothetical protein